jgi:hypothetical protein
MKAQLIGRRWTWMVTAVFLGGFVYSVLALTPRPAYASSCNCTEEEDNAEQYCEQHFGSDALASFTCPIPDPPGPPNSYLFECDLDPYRVPHEASCD